MNPAPAIISKNDTAVVSSPFHLPLVVRIYERHGVRLVRATPSSGKVLVKALPAVISVQEMLLESLDAANKRKRFERLCPKILAYHLG
jgi:hypothetical protein